MVRLDIKQLVTYLKTVFDNTVHAKEDDKPGYFSTYLIRLGEPPNKYSLKPRVGDLLISSEGAGAFKSFMADIRKDPGIGELLSDSSVGIESNKVVIELFNNGYDENLARRLVIEAAGRLREKVKTYTAFLDIEYLGLSDIDELQVGHVTFRTPESARKRIKQISPEFGTTALQPATPFDYKEALKRALVFRDSLGNPSQGVSGSIASCVAEVEIICDVDMLASFAEAKVEEALDLLRCMVMSHPFLSRGNFGLMGSVANGMRRMVYACPDSDSTDENKWHVGNSRTLFLSPSHFEPVSLEFIKTVPFAFSEISEILRLKENERSQIERAIVLAMKWLSRLHKTDDKVDHVIGVAIALETLLIGGSRGEKAESLANRLVLLLGGEKIEQRLKLFENVKAFYTLRSQILHGDDFSGQHKSTLKIVALEALSKFAQNRSDWKTHRDFDIWIKRQMFAPHSNSSDSTVLG